MDNSDSQEDKRPWRKVEVFAKLLGGIGAVAGAIAIPWILANQAEQNRKVQMYAQIMSQREAKDTEIRASMFETLLSKYLTTSSDNKKEGGSAKAVEASELFNEKIVFLSVLMENFQEYFNAKPLFEDLYNKILIAKKPIKLSDNEEYSLLEEQQRKLIKLSRRTASKETSLLSRAGLVSGRIAIKEKCKSSTLIPLFDIRESMQVEVYNYVMERLSNISFNDCDDKSPLDEQSYWNNRSFKNPAAIDGKKYAIRIQVDELKHPEVDVNVFLYEYSLKNRSPAMELISKKPFNFSVSFFDMPYMDNTRLFEGERFAVMLKAICGKDITLLTERDKKKCAGYTQSPEDDNQNENDIRTELEEIRKQISKLDGKIKDSSEESAWKYKEEKTSLQEVENFLANALNDSSEDNQSDSFAVFQVISFKEEFMTLRDRPLFEEMLTKLHKDSN